MPVLSEYIVSFFIWTENSMQHATTLSNPLFINVLNLQIAVFIDNGGSLPEGALQNGLIDDVDGATKQTFR